MISKEEIKKLADLARIDIAEGEQEKLAGEMDAILEYIGQIKAVTKNEDKVVETERLHNVMREDEFADRSEVESRACSKAVIAEFPDKEGDYLKVKKIL